MTKALELLVCTFISLAMLPDASSGELLACANSIFCHGDILHAVQMAKIFDDAKTFVDMRMRYTQEHIQNNFKALGAKPTKAQLDTFVEQNFDEAGNDLEQFNPKDWVEHPRNLKRIKDKTLRSWAYDLNKLWKSLGRTVSADARKHSERSSLIVVDNPFIVPGGRFREYYYWDSYWILNGILVCGMNSTAKGMIENYIELVRRYGFVPNGGRIYYLNRSQPPFLIQMLELYYRYTNDVEFVRRNLAVLEKEYQFWEMHRSIKLVVSGTSRTLTVYKANMTTPRPESYWHDYDFGKEIKDAGEKARFYQAVASAAESGWDFSSRWLNKSGAGNGSFRSIHTPDIVPVDLNCILYKNELSLAKFYELSGNQSKVKEYQRLASRRRHAIEDVLWDEAVGLWVDYDVTSGERTSDFYASSVVALWSGLAHGNKSREEHVFCKLRSAKVLGFPGGLPTSMEQSGQQWDFPNAWPPLQHMFIVALAQSRSTFLQNEARKRALSWVRSNWIGYVKTNHMFEKYVVTSEGNTGGGGEYKPQVGFGWTNGVILDLLLRYPDDLEVENRASMPWIAFSGLLSFFLIAICIFTQT